MVGLYHQVVGTADICGHLVGHASHVGHQTEVGVSGLNEIAHVVAAVVGHGEGGHGKLAQLLGNARLDIAAQRGVNLARHAVVAVDAAVHGLRGIDGHLQLVTHAAHALDVVGMVVGDEHVAHLRQTQSVVAHMLLQRADAHACVYDQRVGVGI